MKKIILFIITISICISLVGCKKSSSTISNSTFDENKAISMVIKDNTDFPSNQTETITKIMYIGDGYTDVKFSTKLEKISESNYVVTLAKDWGIGIEGKMVKSSWKYKVTPNNVTLVESNDNDNLIRTIK